MSKRGLPAFTGIWILFKLVLSAVLLVGVGTLFWLGLRHGFPAWVFGLMGGLVFFAALPWVNMVRPSRALGLVILTIGLIVLVMALSEAQSPERFPRECVGYRRAVFCQLQNLLFDFGGSLLAALPIAAMGVVLITVGARLVLKHLRHPGNHRW